MKYHEILKLAQDYAEEDARNNLKFSGDAPWSGVSPEKRLALEDGLIFYARCGAFRALSLARFHGLIK